MSAFWGSFFGIFFVSLVWALPSQNDSGKVWAEEAPPITKGYLLPTGIYKYTNLGSLNDTIILPCDGNINTWEPPKNISQLVVYYRAGDDYDGRPVWVLEMGKWNVRFLLESGLRKEFECYILQLIHRLIQSIHKRTLEDEDIVTTILIIDAEETRFEQLAHVPTMTYLIALAQEYHHLMYTYMEEGLVINTNYVAATVLKLVQPLLGPSYSKIQSYGSSKSKWMVVMKHKIPDSSLPEWYGGSADFKPLQVYG